MRVPQRLRSFAADSGRARSAQVPMSVTVSEELCKSGVDTVSAELTSALKSAHTKSGMYAQDRMRAMYEEVRPRIRTRNATCALSKMLIPEQQYASRATAGGPLARHGWRRSAWSVRHLARLAAPCCSVDPVMSGPLAMV